MTNKEISAQFSLLAKLMDIHGENSFKVKSYTNAAFAIGKLPFEIEEVGIEAIEGQRGIGKGMVGAILEMMDNEELAALDEIKERTPAGILELLSIRGIGPKKIGQLWRELEIESPGDLLQAIEENRLLALKGFGAKTQIAFQEKLEFYFLNQGSILWSQAENIIKNVKSVIDNLLRTENKEEIQNFLLGDYYWHNQTVQSFDFILNVSTDVLAKLLDTEDWAQKAQQADIINYQYRGQLNFKFICVAENDFDKQKFIHSFSEDVREKLPFNKVSDFSNEDQAFAKMGLQFLPPYLRNNLSAIVKAQEQKLPNIIREKDIKGVIHNHSTWSDGLHSIEQMANACIEKGYRYFVISDHSKTSTYAGGLTIEQIWAQQKEIDTINEKLKPFRVFKSIECDILGDGSLDYDDEVLGTFDLVICSVHQNLNMTKEKAMNRLITAIENPFTSILGHCTGRLLLSRKGYPLDHKKIIDACAANDVVIEINANPRRLDIDWRWIDYAMLQDVLLSINPDAHTIHGVDDIRYGVRVAQKGMLTAPMNLSSFSLSEFEEFLMHQHQKRM